MADQQAIKIKLNELTEKKWDVPAIEARIKKLARKGIPKKKLNPKEMKSKKNEIQDQVRNRAEEYNYVLKNCAQSTALALMEEFGIGNMEIIKALTPFPGIGGSGEICGGITGSLIAFGLFFGSDDRLDMEATSRTIMTAQQFMESFEREVGYTHCANILENVIIGFKLNPGESEEAMMTFAREKGFEKCCMLPGMGVRLAAGFIIDSME